MEKQYRIERRNRVKGKRLSQDGRGRGVSRCEGSGARIKKGMRGRKKGELRKLFSIDATKNYK